MGAPISPAMAAELTQASLVLLAIAAVVAAALMVAAGLSTAVYLHRTRLAIARLRTGEIHVRKPR